MEGGTGLSPASSVDDALETILRHILRLPAEDVSLLEAAGRVLATDLEAPADLWPFPRAAMDGFAVRSEDVSAASPAHPVVLRVLGEVFAGAAPEYPLAAGTAVRIATGAPVSDGADAVIPIEYTEAGSGGIVITLPIAPGAHIFSAGEDARKGEVILRAGTALGAGTLGLLASLGIDRARVVRRAHVAILTAGDELVEPRESLRPGQVRDSNSYALAAAVQEAGGIPRRLGIARDDVDEVAGRLREELATDAVIVCAGMSVGERDVVKQALAQAGVRLVFWRVPMKPGAPAAFGLAGTTPVFGLPGTPGAAMVAFEELVRPALRTMMGYAQAHRPVLTARLTARLEVRPGRRRYLWARASTGNGRLTVRPLRRQGTATLRSISDANALILIDADATVLRRGEMVHIQLLADPDAAGTHGHAVPIVSVVGAKGAGKTVLIERLIPELRRRGYRVAAIKHDAHGFEIDREGTDTWRFAAAGADAVAISGPGKAAFVYEIEGERTMREVAGWVHDIDLIIAEGYSQEAVPKIEVRRRGVTSDKPLPAGPILAVVSDVGEEPTALSMHDVSALANRIEEQLLIGARMSHRVAP